MEQWHKILIGMLLSLGCIGIFVFEMTRRMEVQVTWEKLAAGVVALLYCIALLAAGQVQAIPALIFVFGSAGLVWFGDELGSMTGIYFRGSMVNRTSPGFLVRILGWLFLFLPLGVAVYLHLVSQGR